MSHGMIGSITMLVSCIRIRRWRMSTRRTRSIGIVGGGDETREGGFMNAQDGIHAGIARGEIAIALPSVAALLPLLLGPTSGTDVTRNPTSTPNMNAGIPLTSLYTWILDETFLTKESEEILDVVMKASVALRV
ncbi:hypothetical protein FIBSPDRAFT_1051529 [Athelia psychrophila]|uniref:Uncharacterized protein n=1 Tax=Athelia psychrophila TaxID=1759441 RepID=A0A165YY14_9AGAM|nr:hypothetical protein FIBSPDRAFT_1051529 [Fibularhizoctonia sp. CBS 109695]